jgi:membrane dipeptidase
MLENSFPDLQLVLESKDIIEIKNKDQEGIIFGFQDSEPVAQNLAHLEALYYLGLRVLQLTYQRKNSSGYGCGEPADKGLSSFGKMLVGECNRLGIIIDLSHAGINTFLTAIDLSKAPVMVSHTGCKSLCQHVRNISDFQIRKIAENGGVIGIYAISQFLKEGGANEGAEMEDFVRHVDYVVNLAGSIEHVGIGLDVGTSILENEEDKRHSAWKRLGKEFPELFVSGYDFSKRYVTGLESPAGLPRLTAILSKHGYTQEEITKILGGNFLRLFRQVEEQSDDLKKKKN